MKINIRLPAILALVVLANFLAPAAASDQGNTDLSVVARLYKEFAWQAIGHSSDQPKAARNVFGADLARQKRAVLDQYFDPMLSSLIEGDARCVAKTREKCKLEFDPIFASQDPGAADLLIRAGAPGKVLVEFTYLSSGEKIGIEYRLALIGRHWKITDVVYKTMEGQSLKQLLLRKLP